MRAKPKIGDKTAGITAKPLSSIFKASEVVRPDRNNGLAIKFYGGLLLIAAIVCGLLYGAAISFVDTTLSKRLETLQHKTTHIYLRKLKSHGATLQAVSSRLAEGVPESLRSLSVSNRDDNALEALQRFDYIALLETPQEQQGQPAEAATLSLLQRRHSVEDLLAVQAVSLNLEEFMKAIAQGIIAQNRLHIMTYSALEKALNHLGRGTHNGTDIIFLQPFQKRDGGAGLVFAQMSSTDLFGDLHEVPNDVTALYVALGQNEERVFTFERPAVQEGQGTGAKETSVTHRAVFGGVPWVSTLRVKDNILTYALSQLPYAALVLSGLFTLLAALIFALQIVQDRRTRRVNNILRDKLKALETEAAKREILNQELTRSEKDNLALLNAISDVIFELDARGAIVFITETWERLTGFDSSETRGTNLLNLLSPEDSVAETDRFKRMAEGRQAGYTSRTRLKCKNGAFRRIELHMVIRKQILDGRFHVMGKITDIEGQAVAEHQKHQIEQRYADMLTHAAWGVLHIDTHDKIIAANPAVLNMTGYGTLAELQGTIHKASAQLYTDKIARQVFLNTLQDRQKITDHEVSIVTKDGDELDVRERIRVVNDLNGNVSYYELTLEDITSRKQSDAVLRDAKIHSDMANRAKSEFLTNMSHELRTPLNAIIGFSEIIKNESFGPLGHESYKEYIAEVYEGGKRLLTTINEILDISRIEVRARELNESTVDLQSVMAKTIDLLSAKAKSGQIQVNNELKDAPCIIAEERAMKQIFTNILSNAIKFTPRGGSVRITHEALPSGGLAISFADTGVGLDPNDIQKALSAFGQLGSSLDQGNAGTGLGLTLVKALIELHGGGVEIFSHKGMGTTVTLTLPSARVTGGGQKASAVKYL